MPDRWRSAVPDDWPRLVDGHCHPVSSEDLPDEAFVGYLGGHAAVDAMSGVALRRWCSPVIDLEPHASLEAYLERRRALGADEVNRRLLSRAGVSDLVVDEPTGTDVAATVAAADARSHHVVRLEDLAERLLADGTEPGALADAVRVALDEDGAVAATTLAGVQAAAVPGLTAGPMLGTHPPLDATFAELAAGAEPAERREDPRWHTWLAFAALDAGLPLQVPLGHVLAHGGPVLGDPRAIVPFLRASADRGAAVVLVNPYPHHQVAAVLARAYPHVHLDLGRITRAGGDLSARVVADVITVAPFSRLLYASDGFGIAEHHYLAAVLFRRALGGVLHELVVRDEVDRATSDRIIRATSRDNAMRVYGIDGSDDGR
ncbi:hypothetical protein [Mumia sp. DW29H23]|uniref:hypothetical protein n=1 Tax=Mumia sp. DW29H23 TaxID=3421241 RepID=UPI003D68511D